MPPKDRAPPSHQQDTRDQLVHRLRQESFSGVQATLSELQRTIDTALILRLTRIAFDSGVKAGEQGVTVGDPAGDAQRLRAAHDALHQAYERAKQLQASNEHSRNTIKRLYMDNDQLRKENERLAKLAVDAGQIPSSQATKKPYKDIRVKVAPPAPSEDQLEDLIDL